MIDIKFFIFFLMLQYSSLQGRAMEAANHLKNSAMDAGDHFKNGASSKSLTSRGNFFIVAALILLALVMAVPVHAQISIIPETAKPPKKNNQIPYYEFLLGFESNLNERGFTKQITLWDLVPLTGKNSQTAYLDGGDYAKAVRCLIGIWVNYQDKLVMFRTNGNVLEDGTVVPFEQITEARVKVDAYEETKAQAMTNNPLVRGNNASAKTVTQEIIKSAEVTVVTKGPNGVQNYRIHVSNTDASMNPFLGASAQAHDSRNDKAVPFVQNIADEIDFIVELKNKTDE